MRDSSATESELPEIATGSRIDLSVVVPARNAAGTLGECLAALRGSQGVTFEVIVVDDQSLDATAEIARSHGARVIRLERQSGAAAARNAGARHASAAVLFFTDADVIVRPDSLQRATTYLKNQPHVSAVFGSYAHETIHQNFCSVYKNLVHHLTHQAASPEATSFWSGAGAIRTDAFWAVGGFDPADTRSADVEDIALGYALTRTGYRVRMDPGLQVVHAKRYTFWSLVESDVMHRAIPWTRLMLRERIRQKDLNTSAGGLGSGVVVMLMLSALIGGIRWRAPRALIAPLILLYGYLNWYYFSAFARHGPWFLARAAAMTTLYYLHAALGAGVGLALYIFRDRGSARARRTVYHFY